jgi:hypothetical protein
LEIGFLKLTFLHSTSKILLLSLNLSNLNNFFLYAKIPQKYKNHPKITITFYHHLITIRQPEIPKMVKNHQKWAHWMGQTKRGAMPEAL